MAKKRTKEHRVNPANLYPARRLLEEEDKHVLGLTVPVTVYVQDPLVAQLNPKLGLERIELDWEPGLTDGPTSARVTVVDYNADTGVLVEPVRWERRKDGWRFVGADNPDSFQFHQVNAWAIVQNTLAFFEDEHVLGRAIPWAFAGNRLIVVPHAGYRQNAYYDRSSKSLQFYYCGSGKHPIYTCLSHDIIAHETGHAILDGIRPHYNEISSPETTAFHEFLADLTAILSALRNNTVRAQVAEVSQGDLSQEEVIGHLAEEFAQDSVEEAHGEAARYYLRTAHQKVKMKDIKGKWEPHDCSQVLTGAVFDILTRMTLKHMDKGEKPKDALWHATDRLTRIALRPLDYCPSVDVQFIDYARALLHADALAYPEDALGYREIARKVFRERGLSDLDVERLLYNVEFRRYDISRLSRSRTAAYHFLNENRELLRIPWHQDFAVVDLYDTDKDVEGGRRLPREIVLEYVWSEDVPLEGSQFGGLDGEVVPLPCGGTLVFDGRGNVLSFVRKPGIELDDDREQGELRRERLLDYVARLVEAGLVRLADDREAQGLGIRVPAVIGRRVQTGLRLEATPHLLHESTQ